jgi:hypothetical protein
MIVLVTYDLKKIGHDYGPFHNTLKEQGTWWHYISNTWLLDTEKKPKEIVTALRPFMDSSDSLFVTEITENNSGYLKQKAWDWLARHEKKGSS